MDSLEDKLDNWDTFKRAATQVETRMTINRVDLRKLDKATIVLMGDTHIGSKFYNEKLHREHVKWCEDNGVHLILMGDNIEAATRDSVGAGVYEQQEIIDIQVEHFYDVYRKLANSGQILGMHTGNHCGRVFKSCGVDIAKMMAKELNVPYFGWAKLHRIRVGKETYTVYTCHGASGARLPTSKIKAAFNMGDVVNAEVYAMGHVHMLGHQSRMHYTADNRKHTIHETEKHYVLTGHYLNFWGSYAHMSNMEPCRQGSIKLKLHGDEHLIRVSS